MTLETIIKDRIREQGPISVSDYMQLCLSHPQFGYYIKQDPFGTRGDFITAPEICQIFGELIGIWCADLWIQSGGGPASLVELGPGRGTLMQDALRATRNIPEFHNHLTVQMIETSPVLQTAQFYTLQNAHDRIEWEETIDHLPEEPCLIIANEFFDALPIRQYVQTAEGMKERCIGIDRESNQLCFELKQQGLSLARSDSDIPVGTIIESSQASKEILGRLCDHIAEFGGAILTIDYGYLGQAHQDTLQAVKNHAFHHVLKDPGNADLTAHVDFATLREVAESHGCAVHGPVDQGAFLVRLGAEARIGALLQDASEEEGAELIEGAKRLIDPNQMGSLFKVLGITADHSLTPAGFHADPLERAE
ncbi:MAG: methyltransferase [Rickettsiales bacterium]|nr:methyltransferase [Rickettsiales bacterium]|tara:strand:- start:2465 stop:3559 length:1095 start_codon:yes stop_codon:yes gene_type:complete